MLYACLIKKLIMSFLSFHSIACESPVRNFSTIKTEATIFLLLYILEHNNILASQIWLGFGVIKKTIDTLHFHMNFRISPSISISNLLELWLGLQHIHLSGISLTSLNSFGGLTYNFKVMIRFTVENAVKQSWDKLPFENVSSLKELPKERLDKNSVVQWKYGTLGIG